jgi:hypothetical protein
MTPEFLAAVIDTLLPGDDVLPSGTAAGVALAPQAAHESVLSAISLQAGGSDAFARAGERTRVGILQAIERANAEAFRALVVAALSDYYESGPILAAMGWRADPPQPIGHAMPALDNMAADRLECAQRRGRLWRG